MTSPFWCHPHTPQSDVELCLRVVEIIGTLTIKSDAAKHKALQHPELLPILMQLLQTEDEDLLFHVLTVVGNVAALEDVRAVLGRDERALRAVSRALLVDQFALNLQALRALSYLTMYEPYALAMPRHISLQVVLHPPTHPPTLPPPRTGPSPTARPQKRGGRVAPRRFLVWERRTVLAARPPPLRSLWESFVPSTRWSTATCLTVQRLPLRTCEASGDRHCRRRSTRGTAVRCSALRTLTAAVAGGSTGNRRRGECRARRAFTGRPMYRAGHTWGGLGWVG